MVSRNYHYYKTLLRPILEYASTVWDPHSKSDADKIEHTQRSMLDLSASPGLQKNHDFFKKIIKIGFIWFKSDFFDLNRFFWFLSKT